MSFKIGPYPALLTSEGTSAKANDGKNNINKKRK
jgi:hypothetical protein